MKDHSGKIKLRAIIGKTVISAWAILLAVPLADAFALTITQENIVHLINTRRESEGLQPLRISVELNLAANRKSKDMIKRNYFDHYAYGLRPWDFISTAGYDYQAAGENLAMNFNTAEGVVRAWMNSPAHRDNILNPEFSDLAVGVVRGVFSEGGVDRNTTMVTNMFGQKKTVFSRTLESIKSLFPLY
ncbi:MAG: CAP domain-containing protein [Patescibacteria group bacterium]